MRHRAAIIPALFFLFFSLCASAQAMRCGNDLAYEGLTTTEVVNNCGPPESTRVVRQYYETTRYNNRRLRVKIVVEEWTYDLDDGVIHILTFENGILKKISWIRK